MNQHARAIVAQRTAAAAVTTQLLINHSMDSALISHPVIVAASLGSGPAGTIPPAIVFFGLNQLIVGIYLIDSLTASASRIRDPGLTLLVGDACGVVRLSPQQSC